MMDDMIKMSHIVLLKFNSEIECIGQSLQHICQVGVTSQLKDIIILELKQSDD